MGEERTGDERGQVGWGAQGGGLPPAAPPPGSWQQPGGGQPPVGAPARSTNGLAIAALVCGLLAVSLVIFLVGGFLGVVAVILGIAGLARVRTTGSGRGMAITGIVAGGLAVLLTAGLVAVGVRVWQDPEFQDLLEEEQRRQEELLEDAEQQD